MQPTLTAPCHVPQRLLACNFGQRARPRVLDHGLHCFTRIRDREQNAFPTYWHIQNYFRPSTGGIQKRGALLPHIFVLAGFRRPGAAAGQRFGSPEVCSCCGSCIRKHCPRRGGGQDLQNDQDCSPLPPRPSPGKVVQSGVTKLACHLAIQKNPR